jgi:hypothetical protein
LSSVLRDGVRDICAFEVLKILHNGDTFTDKFNFRNDAPPSEIASRFWNRKFLIYFASCIGTALIMEVSLPIAQKFSINSLSNLSYSYDIFQLILKFVSIMIIIATAIIVVKKLYNKTLREHDDGRAARGSTVDKYEAIST